MLCNSRLSASSEYCQLAAMCRVNFHQMRWNLWGLPAYTIPKWNICKKKRLNLPLEKKRSWQNLHRAHALQFKALGLIRILPAYCHVSSQLPSDALELALELVGSTILHNSQEEHLQKEKVEPSIRKEKKLTEFASSTCTAIQGSRPHQNTTSLLPCVESTSIRCVGTCVGTCGVYHLTQFPRGTSAQRKGWAFH